MLTDPQTDGAKGYSTIGSGGMADSGRYTTAPGARANEYTTVPGERGAKKAAAEGYEPVTGQAGKTAGDYTDVKGKSQYMKVNPDGQKESKYTALRGPHSVGSDDMSYKTVPSSAEQGHYMASTREGYMPVVGQDGDSYMARSPPQSSGDAYDKPLLAHTQGSDYDKPLSAAETGQYGSYDVPLSGPGDTSKDSSYMPLGKQAKQAEYASLQGQKAATPGYQAIDRSGMSKDQYAAVSGSGQGYMPVVGKEQHEYAGRAGKAHRAEGDYDKPISGPGSGADADDYDKPLSAHL